VQDEKRPFPAVDRNRRPMPWTLKICHRETCGGSAQAVLAAYADVNRLSYGMCNPSCKRLTICKLSRRLRFNASETRPLDPM
jgi:hypothetical protein